MTTAFTLTPQTDIWSDKVDDPWKKIKHAIYLVNLARHMTKRPQKIIDIGGGDGGDSIPLALQGHDVTLVDCSASILEEARNRARARNIDRCITFQHIDLESLPDAYPENTFDVILCHNVIQYVSDVPQTINILSQVAQEAGIVSVIGLKRYKDNIHGAHLRRNLIEAQEKKREEKIISPIFDPCVRRFPGQMVVDALQFADFNIIGLYDVRCILDYIDPSEIQLDAKPTDTGDRDPYYVTAHFYQIIAQKIH